MSNYGRDLSGQTFGLLTVLEPMLNKWGNRVWRCRCACGTVTNKPSTHALTHVRVISCGCHAKEVRLATHTTHGMTGTPEYRTWKAIHKRCRNVRNPDYPDYGGRGIRVCERWRDFANFYADMGPRPSAKHSIDRVNNAGPYSPDNCRWASNAQQARNRRDRVLLTHNGVTMNQQDWARTLGLSPSTLNQRRRKYGNAFHQPT